MFPKAQGLTDQPDNTPTRKVASGGIAGALVILALTVVSAFGIEVPGVDLDGLPVGEAFTGLVVWATAYAVRERE